MQREEQWDQNEAARPSPADPYFKLPEELAQFLPEGLRDARDLPDAPQRSLPTLPKSNVRTPK